MLQCSFNVHAEHDELSILFQGHVALGRACLEVDRESSFSKGKFEMTICEINVVEHVCDILQEHLGASVTFSPESDLFNDLSLDSLERVELGLKFEKAFSVKISAVDLRNCVTVEEVIQLVQRVVTQKEAKSA